MGIFSWIRDKIEQFKDWWDSLGKSTYDNDDTEDQVNVDAVLAEVRENINPEISKNEQKCLDGILQLFSDLKEKTECHFPDLVEIIEREEKRTQAELKGTFMKYVKEHISKNNFEFLCVLEMQPGTNKEKALKNATKKVFNEAEKEFNDKLKKNVMYLLDEFTRRLNSRIDEHEAQIDKKINELDELKKEAESGQINIDGLKDKSAPEMEASECIISVLSQYKL